jgi:SH3 domain protein
MTRIAALVALVVLSAALQAQETRYVTDILQLGLYASQDASGSPIRTLVSGTEVTILERIPNFARVRTADGEEGWVKSAFLVAEKPAKLRVAETQARAAELEQQLEETIAARDAALADARQAAADAELEVGAAGASSARLARLQEENEAYEARIEQYRGALPWPWVAGALFVALAAGFMAGYWWLDASIRRRHGGFRVY